MPWTAVIRADSPNPPLLVASRLKDYSITGTAWATKDTNCVLQYSIDSEMQGKDGKVRKTHY